MDQRQFAAYAGELRMRAALMLVAAVGTLSAPSADAMIVISSDRGGLVSDYAARFLGARDSGELVVIDGPCLSACTLVVGMVSRDNVCATPNAVLGFHSAWRPVAGGKHVQSAVASQAMLDVYPTALREWISRRGGLSSTMIFLYGRELAGIVRPCAPAVIASLSKVAKPLTGPKSKRIEPAPFPLRSKRDSDARGGNARHCKMADGAQRCHQAS
jgi:hypothetical protein